MSDIKQVCSLVARHLRATQHALGNASLVATIVGGAVGPCDPGGYVPEKIEERNKLMEEIEKASIPEEPTPTPPIDCKVITETPQGASCYQ